MLFYKYNQIRKKLHSLIPLKMNFLQMLNLSYDSSHISYFPYFMVLFYVYLEPYLNFAMNIKLIKGWNFFSFRSLKLNVWCRNISRNWIICIKSSVTMVTKPSFCASLLSRFLKSMKSLLEGITLCDFTV